MRLGLRTAGFGRSATVGVALGSLIASGLISSGAASAQEADRLSDPSAPVPATLASASWARLRDGSNSRPAPRSVVKIAPGGVAIWGTVIAAGTAALPANSARVVFDRVPEGLRVTPAGVPQQLAGEPGHFSACERDAATVTCSLAGAVASGKAVVAAVALSADSGLPEGEALAAPVRLESGGESSSTPLSVTVDRSAKDELLVQAHARAQIGEKATHKRSLTVYNLGGAKPRKGKTTITLTDVAPTAKLERLTVRKSAWNCKPSLRSCVWNKKRLRAGAHTESLHFSFKIPAKTLHKAPQVQGAHKLTWQLKTKGSKQIAAATYTQELTVVPASSSPRSPLAKLSLTRTADLTVKAVSTGHQRLGGVMRYQVMVSNGGGKAAKRVKITPRLPGHARVTKVDSAPGWKCSARGECMYRKPLGSHKSAGTITLTVKSDAAKARRDKRNSPTIFAASWAKQKANGKLAAKPLTARGAVKDSWLPAPRLSVSTPSRQLLTARGADGHQVAQGMVSGRLAGLESTDFSYKWRQVCGKTKGACPKVTWKDSPHGTVDGSSGLTEFTGSFIAPNVKKATTIWIEGKAQVDGAVVTKQLRFKLKPVDLTLNPRIASTQPGALLGKLRNRSKLTKIKQKPAGTLTITGAKAKATKPGKLVKLRAKVTTKTRKKRDRVKSIRWVLDNAVVVSRKKDKHGKLKAIRWSITTPGRAIRLSTKLSADRRVLEFKMPSAGPVLVSAIATRVDGHSTSGSTSVRPPTQAPAVGSVPPMAGSPLTFCQIYDAIRNGEQAIILGPAIFTVGRTTIVGASCNDTNASINFTDADVTLNGVQLIALTGSITANSLSIRGGRIKLPADSSIASVLTELPFGSTGGPALMSALFNGNGGTLSGLQGTASGLPMPYLPAPRNWGIDYSNFKISYNGSVYSVTLDVTASGPYRGSVSITGGFSTDGSFNLNVTGTNLWPIAGNDGSWAVFSGQGTVSRQAGQPIKYDITAKMVTATGWLEVYGGVKLTNASLRWDQNGFHADAAATITIEGKDREFKVVGQIDDFLNWSVTVTSNYPVVMKYLTLAGLGGKIAMTTPATEGKLPQLSIEINTELQPTELFPAGLGAKITIDKGSAHLGIYCDGKKVDVVPCKNREIQLELDIQGAIEVGGWKQTINTTTSVNVETGEFSLDGIIDSDTHPGFGPKELNLTGVQFFYTNQPRKDPILQGSVCMTDDAMRSNNEIVGARAQFHYGGKWSGSILLVYNMKSQDSQGNKGFCIEYQSTDATRTQDQAAAEDLLPGGDTVGTFTKSLLFVYSSYPTVVSLDNHYPADPGGATVQIEASTLTVIAQLSVSDSIKNAMGKPADPVLMLKLGKTARSATLAYAIGDGGVCMVGNCSSKDSGYAALTLVAGTLSQEGSFKTPGDSTSEWEWSGQAILMFGVQVDVYSPGSQTKDPDGNVFTGARIPVTGSIGVDLGIGKGRLPELRVDLAIGKGEMIYNAFGVDGLNIAQLRLAGTLSAVPQMSMIGLAASVETPKDNESTLGNLTSTIGLQPQTPITFALQIGPTQPCFALQIGDQSGKRLAINWGGAVQANYFEIVFAPNGCRVMPPSGGGEGSLMGAGYSFNFDGAIFGTKTYVFGNVSSINRTATSSSVASGQFALNIGAFNLAGLAVKETKVNLQFSHSKSPTAGYLKFDFTGGVNAWGAVVVDVTGTIDASAGLTSKIKIDLKGSATANLGIFKSALNFRFAVDFQYDIAGAPEFSTLIVQADAYAEVLIFKGNVELNFDYSDGRINQMYASVMVGVNLYAVSLEGTLTVGYKKPDSGDGAMGIAIDGKLRYWAFGWQEHSGRIVDLTYPVHFDDPIYPKPDPDPYTPPTPPIPYWDPAQWDYQQQMFMGINWDPQELAAAAGVSNVANLAYGEAATDPTLGTPDVQYKEAQVKIDDPDDGDTGTHSTVVVTVTLPQTPTYARVVGAAEAAKAFPPARMQQILAGIKSCAGGTTKTFKIKVPKWQDGAPITSSSAALVVSEVNWRIYLSSVIETSSVSGGQSPTPGQALLNYKCGYGTDGDDPWPSFPSLDNWLAKNKQGIQFNLAYPLPHRTDVSQFCLTGFDPDSDFGRACKQNLNLLRGAWGTGWGAGGSKPPQSWSRSG